MLYRVKDLSPEQRHAAEILLGHSVSDDETVSQLAILSQPYHAPVRDTNDLDVLQTAERGATDILCTEDSDFHDDPIILAYCAVRGIEVCHESTLLARIVGS